jgi:hypothetical protein
MPAFILLNRIVAQRLRENRSKIKFKKGEDFQSSKSWSLRTMFLHLTTTFVTTNYHPKTRAFSATPLKYAH